MLVKEAKRTVFSLLLLSAITSFRSGETDKNYLQFHRAFSEIEELIVNESFARAELKMDSLFAAYPVKFAKDYVVAAQISLLNGHNTKALELIKHSLKMGAKVGCLQNIGLLKNKLSESDWREIKLAEAPLHEEYLSGINLELYKEFHTRYGLEQSVKGTPKYASTVSSNFQLIKGLLEKGQFPGDASIGIDNSDLAKSLSDCSLGNSRVIVTLFHYNNTISELGEAKLLKEIQKGNLHPRDYAAVYTFERNGVSILPKKSANNRFELPDYRFNFPFGRTSQDLERVNTDRAKFGICEYQVDLKKDAISRKYGLKLKFDYR